MSVNISGITIEKLVGRENYPDWKIAIRAFLELDDYWSETIEYDKETKKVDPDKDRKCKSKLILCIDKSCYVHINGAKTALETWNKLAEAFEDNGLARRVGLLHKLVTSQLTSCGSMEKYVNQVITTAHALNGIDFNISEEWIGTLLLAGLPEDYRPMIMALENSGIKISGDSIKTKLLQEVGIPSIDSDDDVALLAGSKIANSKSSKFCTFCEKSGHLRKNCYKRLAIKKQVADSSSEDEHQSDKVGDFVSFAFRASEKSRNPIWIIDSGASNHMSSSKKFFDKMQPCKKKIHLANGKVLICSGIGSGVILGVNEKKEPVKLVVSNVLYVPELQGNLLSVNCLAQKGFKVQFESDGCQIIQKDEIVVVGEVKTGIYQLKCFDKNPKFKKPNAQLGKHKKQLGECNYVQSKEEPNRSKSKKVIAFSAVVVSRARLKSAKGNKKDLKIDRIK
jgi:hypothetical protein